MEDPNRNARHINNNVLGVENLSLNDDDDELEIDFNEEEVRRQQQSFNLVGRFLTNRPIRTNMMMNKMGDIWQPGKGMNIEETQPGLFVFRFFHQLDVQHVLKQGPWSFDNHTLVLNVLPDDVEPHDVPLVKVPFWIQIHNLPSGYMSLKVGEKVGNYIGEFLEYDEKNDNFSWRKHMRIRVLVDIRLPLKKSKSIKKPGGESKIVNFKYERLGTFCYVCGLLGHSENRCPKLFDMATNDVVRGWSPELRADTGRKQAGESKWLRHGSDANWAAPDPAFMSNKCESSKSGSNVSTGDKEVNDNQEVRSKKLQLADIFRNPKIIFPKEINANNEAKNSNETMEEDDVATLMVEGDRKRSRSTPPQGHVVHNMQVLEEEKNHNSNTNSTSSSGTFLMAGPGRARQGQ
jgi:14-3-3 protein epsilon